MFTKPEKAAKGVSAVLTAEAAPGAAAAAAEAAAAANKQPRRRGFSAPALCSVPCKIPQKAV